VIVNVKFGIRVTWAAGKIPAYDAVWGYHVATELAERLLSTVHANRVKEVTRQNDLH
jgi:hypothetical protein